MRIALLQLTSSDDPETNLPETLKMLQQAADAGAQWVLTPEVTNCVSASRTRQIEVLQPETEDITLTALRRAAETHGVWVLIGSLALKSDDPDGRFANRSFLIDPKGTIVARYDKMHMFDVEISATEQYRESAGYRPGDRPILAPTTFGQIGMTICYDIRFPYLYRHLAQAGASILTVPSAFSTVSGAAHWEVLLRARAIENGAWVLAPAQCGTHSATRGKARQTWGHSLVIAPWGEVVADAGEMPGILLAEIDSDAVGSARARIPSLTHDRPLGGPAE